MKNNDEYFMRQALKEAEIALSIDEVPIGCVIVKDKKIIACAHNLKETDQNPTHHAEILAINEASKTLNSWRLDDCEIYVNVEPCLMCLGAIVSARFKRLIYGVKDTKYGSLDNILTKYLKNYNHHLEVTSNILAEESKLLLASFFKNLRNKN
ncbi:MAG: nucleoside deaminase [Bacillota bacterium]